MTIEGFNALLTMPDFAGIPRISGMMKFDQADLSEARRINAFVGERPIHSFTHKFKFTNRADAEAYEDFMDALAGKWGAFWIPSWHAELNPVADVSTNTIQITPVKYATVYDPTNSNPVALGHYIFLIHYDGTFLVRKVLSVTGTSPEVLTLDAPVTKYFALGEFFVGFIYCVRSISDEIAMTFDGMRNIESDLGVVEVMRIDNGQ